MKIYLVESDLKNNDPILKYLCVTIERSITRVIRTNVICYAEVNLRIIERNVVFQTNTIIGLINSFLRKQK
jgi:hypothetical protein